MNRADSESLTVVREGTMRSIRLTVSQGRRHEAHDALGHDSDALAVQYQMTETHHFNLHTQSKAQAVP
jgi:hypothetical protein